MSAVQEDVEYESFTLIQSAERVWDQVLSCRISFPEAASRPLSFAASISRSAIGSISCAVESLHVRVHYFNASILPIGHMDEQPPSRIL